MKSVVTCLLFQRSSFYLQLLDFDPERIVFLPLDSSARGQ